MASLPNSLWQPPFGTAVVYDNATSQWIQLATNAGTGNIPGVIVLTDSYPASGSDNQYLGTISLSAAHTLTLTTASDFVTGQGVFIAGAGAGGTDLVTIAAGVGSGGQSITLQDAASTAVITHLVQHDDGVAIQAAIDATWTAGGGTIIIPAGFYRINGPFTDYNSILKLPYSPVNNPGHVPPNGPIIGVSLVGIAPSFPAYVGPQTTGVIIQTDKVADLNHSMIAANLFSGEANPNDTQVNNIFCQMDGICWRTYDNPQITAVDMSVCGMLDVRNITIDVGTTLSSISQPTHGTYGFRLPFTATAGITQTHNVFVQGYAIGYAVGEVWTMSGSIVAFRCLTAYRILDGYVGTGGISRLTGGWCPKMVEIGPTATHVGLDLLLMWEQEAGVNWYNDHGTDFVDPSNVAIGTIRYVKILDPPHAATVASQVGFTNTTIISEMGLGAHLIGPIATTDVDITASLNLLGFPVSFGAADSAGVGFRQVRVPNVGASERALLYNAGAGQEAPLSGSTLSTGLISFWNLNEATGATAVDSQAVNNLLDQGTCPQVAGKISFGRGFDGATQFLHAGAGGTGLNPGTSYTISAWVYLTDNSATRACVSRGGVSGDQYFLTYDQPSDRFRFIIFTGSYEPVLANSFGAPALNTWYFLTAWYDSVAGRIFIQVNDGAIDSAMLSGSQTVGVGDFFISSFRGTSSYWQGRVDAVGFWNRVLNP